MSSPRNRLEAPWLDASLHLLDRQVVDVDGKLVCNVDDLELTATSETDLAVTGLLVGGAALWPRLSGSDGGWMRQMWLNLGIQYAGRDVPAYLGLDVVEEIGSAVTLSAAREGLLGPQPDASDPGHHRFGHLQGMKVRTADGTDLGKVLDARLEPRGRRSDRRLVLTHLIVGRGRPGSMLGYDRGDFRGPWLVRRLVLYLHRHTGKVPMTAVERIDWEDAHLTVDGQMEPLA